MSFGTKDVKKKKKHFIVQQKNMYIYRYVYVNFRLLLLATARLVLVLANDLCS